MSFGELIGALFGWLGGFVQWLFGWVPIYEIVQVNERGVKYPRGHEACELEPGIHWYVPNLTQIVKHHVNRCVLQIEPLSLESDDGIPVQVGMVLTYRIVDVLTYEVDNFEAEESMAEVAQGELQDIVTSHKWGDLCGPTSEGTRLGGKLARRMGKALEPFGVEVETCRPTDQVRLGRALRLFGIDQTISFGRG